MPWALNGKGGCRTRSRAACCSRTAAAWRRLATYEDLVRLPGSYWVAPDGKTVHIHAFGGGDPNGKLFEAAVQPHIFKPQGAGFGFIRVSGLILEHCANRFLRTGIGALFTMGGHHWIIERNTVRHVNSVGIEIGYRIFERQDKRYTRRQDPNLGHTIVRDNRIYDCGTAGIRGHTNIYASGRRQRDHGLRLAGCRVPLGDGRHQAADQHGNAGPQQSHRADRGRRRHLARLGQPELARDRQRHPGHQHRAGRGVRGSLAAAEHGGPQRVLEHRRPGRPGGRHGLPRHRPQPVRAGEAEDLVVARVATDRSLGGRRLTSRNNRVVNNIFVDCAKPLALGDGNAADHNVFVSGNAELDTETLLLSWKAGDPLPAGPVLKGCERDFFGRMRDGAETVPGSFVALSHSGTLRLGR